MQNTELKINIFGDFKRGLIIREIPIIYEARFRKII